MYSRYLSWFSNIFKMFHMPERIEVKFLFPSLDVISSIISNINNKDCYICTVYYNNSYVYIINHVYCIHLCIQTLIWPENIAFVSVQIPHSSNV